MDNKKQIESEVLKVYNMCWDAYMKGDMDKFSQYMDEEAIVVGTAEHEIFYDKADAMAFYRATADQISGKLDLRDRKFKVKMLGDIALVFEFSQIVALIDNEWTPYSPCRITSLLRRSGNSWSVIHQHGSFPDKDTDEGQQVSFEKVSKENKALRKAVKERTKELEERTRDLEIEAALERVRTVAMSMATTGDLLNISQAVFVELQRLGFRDLRNVLIDRFYDDIEHVRDYDYSDFSGGTTNYIPYTGHPVMEAYVKSIRKTKEPFVPICVSGKGLEDWKSFRKSNGEVDDPRLEGIKALYYYNYSVGDAAIGISTFSEVTPEQLEVLRRFRNVFDLCYQRYLDISNAESQAKEARIILALEKIRSRSLAVHKTDEFNEVVTVVFEQLQELHIPVTSACINISIEDSRDALIYACGQNEKGLILTHFRLKYFENPIAEQTNQARLDGFDFFSKTYGVKDKDEYYEYQFRNSALGQLPEESKAMIRESPAYTISMAIQKHTSLVINDFTGRMLSDIETDILKRFSKVFEQAYSRFLDLKKAEAQTREARIEASLERVRAKAMAMHHSGELDEVLTVLFEQFDVLNIHPMSTHMTLIDIPSNTFTFRETGKGGRRSYGQQIVPIDSMDIWKEAAEKWKNSEPLSVNKLHFPPESLPLLWQVFYESFASMPEGSKIYPEDYPNGIYHTAGNCQFGYLGMNQTRPATEEEEQIVVKFATEFGRFYQRFLDLQKAESQAKEAKVEAALERVRAKAMAMHSSRDLADTIKAYYEELESFSITPRRCGVGLLNKENKTAELSTMNTTEQGKSLEVIGTVELQGHPVLEQIHANWLLSNEYHPVLRGKEISDYYKILRPQIPFPDHPEDDVLYGYFFFFPEGGVYAWTTVELDEEELKIYRRFTSALSLTYKRYKDLQQAEALAEKAEQDLVTLKEEKQKTEEALAELRVTQSQLIQAEKMASLGELTAGIAHEIQNPLNFVNNFSEVSNELIDEMIEEVQKGNYDEVKAIAEDVRQNLEKINHHGKRADGIVKGMLQHSRSSSGQLEPTDINALADEYLRLAYHGLRAKDKSFNATLKAEYDSSIVAINVMPQDIGRVILNLITNAFYVVNEKKKEQPSGYDPTVTVKTWKQDKMIEIVVVDNGNGISPSVLEKIFQPFFTTKPTGQGTGLGLSLSYDIVKAHGGRLSVDTKVGEGTSFTIILPIV